MSRLTPVTRQQYLARRNALWLTASEHGLPHPDGGLVPFSVADLAGIWRVDPQTVRDGIASAKLADAELGKARDDA